MSTKLDQVVEYIQNLEVGAKISIKSLAQALGISSGTAYHGIKRAEQLSLVVTLPKAGTTRIEPPAPTFLTLSDLMQPPVYLFLNDLVADARQMFRHHGIAKIPVVDDHLRFMGTLDSYKAFDFELSQRISFLYEPGSSSCAVVPSDASVQSAMNAMLEHQANAVFVTDGGVLEGMITSADFLRAAGPLQTPEAVPGRLLAEPDESSHHPNRRLYSVSLPETEAPLSAQPYLLRAFDRYCQQTGIHATVLSETTALCDPQHLSGKITLSVEQLSNSAVFECLLFKNSTLCLKMTLSAALNQ